MKKVNFWVFQEDTPIGVPFAFFNCLLELYVYFALIDDKRELQKTQSILMVIYLINFIPHFT